MNKIFIEGGHPLRGEIRVSGCKNTSLAVLPAVLLIRGTVILRNVPNILDVRTMITILKEIGVEVEFLDEHTVKLHVGDDLSYKITSIQASSIRGSLFLLGSLLPRVGKISLPYPGGCNIGTRPIDLHEKGLRILGYKVEISNGHIYGEWEKFESDKVIYFDFPSVGATENILMAAALTPGYTVIENAATDPQVVALSAFLSRIGVKIYGIGTRKIIVKGKGEPYDVGVIEWKIPGDYLEAGTFLLYGAAIPGSRVRVVPAYRGFLAPLIAKLHDIGVSIEITNGGITVLGTSNIQPARVRTLPFPGFPTDLQPIISVVLTQANGESIIQELVHDRRFGYVNYLLKMGANIVTIGQNTIIVNGRSTLFGTDVTAENLRAGAALILAGLIAEGKTIVNDMYHVYRGYENIVRKLVDLGAYVRVLDDE